MVWYCGGCGEANQDNENTCHQCGRPRGRTDTSIQKRLEEEQKRTEELLRQENRSLGAGVADQQAAGQRMQKCVVCLKNFPANYMPTHMKTHEGGTPPFWKRADAWIYNHTPFRGSKGKIGGYDASFFIEILIGTLLSYFVYFLIAPALGDLAVLIFIGSLAITLSVIFPPHGQIGVVRSIFRWGGFVLIGLALASLNSFLALVVLFIGYFSLPSRVRSAEVGDEVAASLKVIMGVFISFMIYVLFNGGWNVLVTNGLLPTNEFSIPMLFISLGLLLTIPKNDVGSQNRMLVFLGRGGPHEGTIATVFVFAGVLLGVLGSLGTSWILALVFGMLGLAAVFVAWTIPPEERPIVGAPLVIIFLLVFLVGSETVQASVGEATFGVYWPQVQNALEPVGQLFQGVGAGSGTLSVGFECIVDPIGCQSRFTPQQRTQGTVKAVEITGLQLAGETSITRMKQQTRVLLDVRNDGEEDSGPVVADLSDPMLGTGKKLRDVGAVTVSCPTNKQTYKSQATKNLHDQLSTVRKQNTWCLIESLFPGENTQIIATYDVDLTKTQGIQPRGNFVNYIANITYAYNVSSALDVTLMRGEFYDELARNNRLTFTDVPTTDTGGPVRLGMAIYNNRMPIRAGLEAAPILMQLTNQGSGRVVRLYIAKVNVSDVLREDFEFPEPPVDECSTENDQLSFRISSSAPIESPTGATDTASTYRRSTCIVPLRNIEVETQTGRIVAKASYEYTITKTVKSPVEFGTGKLCQCTGGPEGSSSISVTVGAEFCEEEAGVSDCDRYCEAEGYTGGQCKAQ